MNFAHRTFIWANESATQAHVYCVIIGFSYAGSGTQVRAGLSAYDAGRAACCGPAGWHAGWRSQRGGESGTGIWQMRRTCSWLGRSKPISDVPEMWLREKAHWWRESVAESKRAG